MMLPEMLEKTREALCWQCDAALQTTGEARAVHLGMIRETGNALSEFYTLAEMVDIARRSCSYTNDFDSAYAFLNGAWDGIESADGREWVSA